MDPALGTVLAALVAAATYATSEVLRGRRDRASRRAEAFSRVTTALGAVVRAEVRPRIARPWNRTDIEVSLAAGDLIAVLSGKEQVLWDWLGEKVGRLGQATDPAERVQRSSDIHAVLVQWQRDRKVARRYVLKELVKMKAEGSVFDP